MGLPVQQNELRSVAVAARVQLANRPVSDSEDHNFFFTGVNIF